MVEGVRPRKEEVILSLFTDNVSFYVEKPRECIGSFFLNVLLNTLYVIYWFVHVCLVNDFECLPYVRY